MRITITIGEYPNSKKVLVITGCAGVKVWHQFESPEWEPIDPQIIRFVPPPTGTMSEVRTF